jgi:uncharacterized membrane protein YcaP (DUF421 family)
MDVAIRAAVAFLFIYVLTRAVGRRELGSMEPFDLILLVVLGDLIQQGITQSDYSVVGLFLAASVMGLMTVAFSYVSWRFPRMRPLLDGEPIVIVHDGQPIETNLRRERLSLGEVRAQARLQQIESLDEVKLAVLETSGQISFIKKSG